MHGTANRLIARRTRMSVELTSVTIGSPPAVARIVRRARRVDFGEMCARPVDESAHELTQGSAERCEGILDARWHLGIYLARHEAVALHSAQSHRQHPLADSFDLRAQLVEAQRPGFIEQVDDGN